MKKLVLALLPILCATAAVAEKPSSNPADYPLTVHVLYSRSDKAHGYQVLQVVIDGRLMELQSEGDSGQGVLALGDYKAQIGHTGYIPSHQPKPWDVYTVYRFLFADGSIRDFDVVALGQPVPPRTPANP